MSVLHFGITKIRNKIEIPRGVALLVLKRVLGAGWRSVPEVHELRWHPGEELVAVGYHPRGEREQRVPVGAGVERVVYLHGKKKPRRVCPRGLNP